MTQCADNNMADCSAVRAEAQELFQPQGPQARAAGAHQMHHYAQYHGDIYHHSALCLLLLLVA